MGDRFLVFAALFTLVLTFVVLCVSFFYALPRTIGARRRNRTGAIGIFAGYQLLVMAMATTALGCFFFTALDLLLLPDVPLRSLIARLLILLSVVCLSVIVGADPVARKRIDAARAKAKEEADLKDIAEDNNRRIKVVDKKVSDLKKEVDGEEPPST